MGPSGCGKSTLLNLIGKIDCPSEGKIFFKKKEIAKMKDAQLSSYRSCTIGFVFQHYHLLEKQSALYNLMLPALLAGDSFTKAKKKAKTLALSFNLDEQLLKKNCALLSGGEKERIAIIRAFINKPQILLADEPTGALDENNAILAMETLKMASQKSLVIVVTHNLALAYRYSDKLIHLNDGSVVKEEDIDLSKCNKRRSKNKITATCNSNWYLPLLVLNFKKRFFRNIFSILSLVIGITASMLIFGVKNGADISIKNSAEKQFNIGVLSVNKERKIVNQNSPITLVQNLRLSEAEILQLATEIDYCHFRYSYEALVNPVPSIKVNEEPIEGFSYLPIYSFEDTSINQTLLSRGKIPKFDSLNQVLINENAYKVLQNILHSEPLNSFMLIESNNAFNFYTENSSKPYITDHFVFARLVEIVGVVEEMNFLSTPKIFYSYQALDRYMSEALLPNLSSVQGEMSWKERVEIASDNEDISNFSHLVFLKNYEDVSLLRHLVSAGFNDYVFTSNGVIVEETLFSLVNAASVGMEIFLAIALIGTILIISLIAFASYSEDIKDSAILLCLGARHEEIVSLYVFENMALGLISFLLALVITLSSIRPLNTLISKTTSLVSLIDVPLSSYRGQPLLFPLLVSAVTLLVCVLTAYVPLTFAKRISLSEELKAND